jgi:Tol biopolymer transport system component
MRSLLFLLAAAPLAAQSDSLLANPRQLTFSGKRAGEGYFSADGKRMVFQSERDPANPFYQIYLLDFATGDVRRLSNGSGKTTCSWLFPDNQSFLYASTHEDPTSPDKQAAELKTAPQAPRNATHGTTTKTTISSPVPSKATQPSTSPKPKAMTPKAASARTANSSPSPPTATPTPTTSPLQNRNASNARNHGSWTSTS